MSKAYIHASISTSVQVAELSLLGQVLFDRMPAHADHQGRLPGHPKKVKALVVPLMDTSAKEVEEQLRRMHDLGLILWYEASGEKFIQLVSWWKFQERRFAHPSRYPAPEGWKDRLRFNDPHNPKILVEENWVAHVHVGRPRKDRSNEPIQDAYVGDLHRAPIQVAYEGSEINPSSSASAFLNKPKTLSSSPDDPPVPSNGHFKPEDMARLWNEGIDFFEKEGPVLIPRVQRLTADRKKKAGARIRDCQIDEAKWKEIINLVHKSSFLSGERSAAGHENWKATFDFVIRSESSVTKIIEGGYA
jgi:hypothetical protein